MKTAVSIPDAGQSLSRLKESWRSLLIEELSKETYNALAELQAVVDSQVWDDAARLVTSLDPDVTPGVRDRVTEAMDRALTEIDQRVDKFARAASRRILERSDW